MLCRKTKDPAPKRRFFAKVYCEYKSDSRTLTRPSPSAVSPRANFKKSQECQCLWICSEWPLGANGLPPRICDGGQATESETDLHKESVDARKYSDQEIVQFVTFIDGRFFKGSVMRSDLAAEIIWDGANLRRLMQLLTATPDRLISSEIESSSSLISLPFLEGQMQNKIDKETIDNGEMMDSGNFVGSVCGGRLDFPVSENKSFKRESSVDRTFEKSSKEHVMAKNSDVLLVGHSNDSGYCIDVVFKLCEGNRVLPCSVASGVHLSEIDAHIGSDSLFTCGITQQRQSEKLFNEVFEKYIDLNAKFNQTLKDLSMAIGDKDKREDDLLTSFRNLLNSKKKKCRELKEENDILRKQIESLRKHNKDGSDLLADETDNVKMEELSTGKFEEDDPDRQTVNKYLKIETATNAVSASPSKSPIQCTTPKKNRAEGGSRSTPKRSPRSNKVSLKSIN